MVFILYTGTYKLLQDSLNASLNLTDQYEISIFIAIQNGDYNLALEYMRQQNFLIDMILSMLGWMSNFEFLFPWWKALLEKLLGIKERNKMIMEKLLDQWNNYNNHQAPWNNIINQPSDYSLPDDDWAKPGWNQNWKPPRPPTGGTWQPRPPPGGGRNKDGTLYPPISPRPLPWPKPGGGGERPSPQPAPPSPPSGWDEDREPEDWWKKPEHDGNRPPDDEPPVPDREGGSGWTPPGIPPDPRRRCGY